MCITKIISKPNDLNEKMLNSLNGEGVHSIICKKIGNNWECNKLCITGKIDIMEIVSIFKFNKKRF